MCQRAKFIEIGQTVVEIIAIYPFIKLAAVRHFRKKFGDDPQRVLGGLYHCAEFWLESLQSF